MAPRVKPTPTSSEVLRQKVRAVVTSTLDQHFKATLGTEPNIVNYVMALIYYESGTRPNQPGPYVSEVPTAKQKYGSSRARQYMASAGVKAILKDGDQRQKANLQSGKIAQGLMQVMGWNIVRGGSSKSGKCEIEETRRADLIAKLVIEPGDSISGKLLGEANIENNVLAGLLILETKYNNSKKKGTGWSAGGAVFSSRLSAAVGAYLGVGGTDLVTGKTASEYVATIIGGDAYRKANGSSYKIAGVTTPSGGGETSVKSAQSASSGPTTNGTGQPNTTAGC